MAAALNAKARTLCCLMLFASQEDDAFYNASDASAFNAKDPKDMSDDDAAAQEVANEVHIHTANLEIHTLEVYGSHSRCYTTYLYIRDCAQHLLPIRESGRCI